MLPSSRAMNGFQKTCSQTAVLIMSHSGLFDRWNEALATKDPATVANLYGHDAVLLPTVSNEVRITDFLIDLFGPVSF
jgi:hypothetical protein